MKSKKNFMVLVLGMIIWQTGVVGSAPMGTAWTYQGRLMDANDPADGLYDFMFGLFDGPEGFGELGVQVIHDLDVIDGYFTVELDFGSDVFDGSERWLHIEIRPGELHDPNEYTMITPRQRIAPTPYALQTRGIFVDSDGKVGIGTTNPEKELHVKGNYAATFAIEAASSYLASMDFHHGGSREWSIRSYPFSLSFHKENKGDLINITNEGRVGIGATSPVEILHIEKLAGSLGIRVSSDAASYQYINFGATNGYSIGRAYDDKFFINRDEPLGSGLLRILTVKPNGKIGIGTKNPVVELHIASEETTTGLRLENLNATSMWDVFCESNGHFLLNESNQSSGYARFRIYSGGNTTLVPSGGKVGVGTITPTGKLHVETSAANEFAVHGNSGTGAGVYGETGGSLYAGVYGKSTHSSSPGTFGENTATNTRGSLGGPDWGVSGYSPDGHGVQGQSTDGAGVYGETAGISYAGVHGKATNALNAAVLGENTASNTRGTLGGPTWGVKGVSTSGRGVDGSSASGYGVYGESSTGYAGYFDGDVYVTATMSAETVIDRHLIQRTLQQHMKL